MRGKFCAMRRRRGSSSGPREPKSILDVKDKNHSRSGADVHLVDKNSRTRSNSKALNPLFPAREGFCAFRIRCERRILPRRHELYQLVDRLFVANSASDGGSSTGLESVRPRHKPTRDSPARAVRNFVRRAVATHPAPAIQGSSAYLDLRHFARIARTFLESHLPLERLRRPSGGFQSYASACASSMSTHWFRTTIGADVRNASLLLRPRGNSGPAPAPPFRIRL